MENTKNVSAKQTSNISVEFNVFYQKKYYIQVTYILFLQKHWKIKYFERIQGQTDKLFYKKLPRLSKHQTGGFCKLEDSMRVFRIIKRSVCVRSFF